MNVLCYSMSLLINVSVLVISSLESNFLVVHILLVLLAELVGMFPETSGSEIEGIISNKTRNRLTALREYLRQYGSGVVGLHQRSLDSHPHLPTALDNENDYVACNEEKRTYFD